MHRFGSHLEGFLIVREEPVTGPEAGEHAKNACWPDTFLMAVLDGATEGSSIVPVLRVAVVAVIVFLKFGRECVARPPIPVDVLGSLGYAVAIRAEGDWYNLNPEAMLTQQLV